MILYVALSAFGGGVIAGLLGWLEKGLPFSWAKFLPTVLRAFIAGASIAIADSVFIHAQIGDGLWGVLIAAFLVGAGFDVVAHRVAGTIKAK